MTSAASGATVNTVTGPVPAEELNGVLAHEHLLALLVGPGACPPHPHEHPSVSGTSSTATGFDACRVHAAVAALDGLPGLGFDTVVDLSPYGDAGRDPHGTNVTLLRDIARLSGMHIVAGTATYREEFSPTWVREATLDQLTARFVADATTGIGPTDVRAGILGEQPSSDGIVTEHERRGLRAAARAQQETGLAISTHTTHGSMAGEQLDILAVEGADLTRVIIGHMDNHADLDATRRVLDRGATVGFDSIGKQRWDVRLATAFDPRPDGPYRKDAIAHADQTRAEHLAALVEEGYAAQIVVAHDLTGGQNWLNPDTHGTHGYRYLAEVFLPRLRDLGVSDPVVTALTRDNPARLLAT